MNNILLIDDDPEFKDAFQMDIQNEGIRLIHEKSFDGLKKVMPKIHHKISAVVLDIKCLISDDQSIEHEGFIGTAIKYLDTNFPRFPRLILTGDDDAFGNYKKFSPDEDIYQKTPEGIKEVIVKLKHYDVHSISLRIKRNNSLVFELFEEGYYNSTSEMTLLSLIERLNETAPSKFGGIFRDIRALQETIYKIINQKDKVTIPDNMFRGNGMIKFNDLMTHLSGHPTRRGAAPTSQVYQSSSVFNLADSLYWTCGENIHANPAAVYSVSNYTVKAMIYNLMELFLWSKQYLA